MGFELLRLVYPNPTLFIALISTFRDVTSPLLHFCPFALFLKNSSLYFDPLLSTLCDKFWSFRHF